MPVIRMRRFAFRDGHDCMSAEFGYEDVIELVLQRVHESRLNGLEHLEDGTLRAMKSCADNVCFTPKSPPMALSNFTTPSLVFAKG